MLFMKRFLPPCLVIFCLVNACANAYAGEAVYSAAPTVLSHVARPMKTSGFWISRHPFPDKVVMTPEEIQQFNFHIKSELKLTKDILALPAAVSGNDLRASMENIWSEFKSRNYFAGDKKASAAFYKDIKKQMDLPGLAENIPIQFG